MRTFIKRLKRFDLMREILLAIFGWIPYPASFVDRDVEYMKMCLKDYDGVSKLDILPDQAYMSILHLAYTRAASLDQKRRARWRNYWREVEKVSTEVAQALTG